MSTFEREKRSKQQYEPGECATVTGRKRVVVFALVGLILLIAGSTSGVAVDFLGFWVRKRGDHV